MVIFIKKIIFICSGELFFSILGQYPMGLDARKPVFGLSEQQRRRPACTFAQIDQHLSYLHFGCIISKHATGEISMFQLVSVAEQAGLKSHSVGNLENRFCRVEAQRTYNSLNEGCHKNGQIKVSKKMIFSMGKVVG